MGIKKTLASIASSALITLSPLVGKLHAEPQPSRMSLPKQVVKHIELPGDSPVETFYHEFKVPLRQIQGFDDVDMGGDGTIILQGEVDYNSGSFTLAYSSGIIGENGLVTNIYQQTKRNVDHNQTPIINDGLTKIFLLSPNAEDPNKFHQQGFFFPKNQKRDLVPLEDHQMRRMQMELAKQGLEALIELGDDAFQAKTGIAAIPSDTIKDKLRPFARFADYLTKRILQEKEDDKRDVFEKFKERFNVYPIPMHVDSSGRFIAYDLIGRSIEAKGIANNVGSDDKPMCVYIKNITIGRPQEIYGELKDISIMFTFKANPTIKSLEGYWEHPEQLGGYVFFGNPNTCLNVMAPGITPPEKYSCRANQNGETILTTEKGDAKINIRDNKYMDFLEFIDDGGVVEIPNPPFNLVKQQIDMPYIKELMREPSGIINPKGSWRIVEARRFLTGEHDTDVKTNATIRIAQGEELHHAPYIIARGNSRRETITGIFPIRNAPYVGITTEAIDDDFAKIHPDLVPKNSEVLTCFTYFLKKKNDNQLYMGFMGREHPSKAQNYGDSRSREDVINSLNSKLVESHLLLERVGE